MIYRLLCRALALVGLVPAREATGLLVEVLKLERENELLKKELEECVDENKSLWTMMDELKDTSQMDPKTVEDFLEEIKDSIMDEMLRDFDPVGEA